MITKMLQETSLEYSDSIKYTVQICFDQPYYYSSEQIKCSLKVLYERFGQEKEALDCHELLDYITIQLFGYASISNETLSYLNSPTGSSPAPTSASTSSISQLISNIFNITSRLDLLGLSGKQNCQKNKPIFVSNPHILASDVKICKPKGEIGSFLYTCFLPPFIPPTFSGKLVSFNYIALVTIGINNKLKLERSSQLLNLDFLQDGDKASLSQDSMFSRKSTLPTIQKKLKFDIRCLGPHQRSSGLLFSPVRRTGGSYHPITALSIHFNHSLPIDDFSSIVTSSSEKMHPPVAFSMSKSSSNIFETSDLELLSTPENNPKLILDHLNNQFKRKAASLKTIISQSDLSASKMRFFELHDINVYSSLNFCPKSLLEIYWENEISSIHSPEHFKNNPTFNQNHPPSNNDESLIINYKGELVMTCKISNSNSWSSSHPIIIHFDFSKSYWKTQEIHVKVKRIEVVRQSPQDTNGIKNQTIIHNYRKCTLWDLEFSHQVGPLSSFLIPSFDSDTFYIYYQLSFDFFIYSTEKKVKRINFLDVNRFPNLIKLSWNSSPITYFGQLQRLQIQSSDQIGNLSEINSLFHPMLSIMPYNCTCFSKSIEF